jgi:hypothetical protein
MLMISARARPLSPDQPGPKSNYDGPKNTHYALLLTRQASKINAGAFEHHLPTRNPTAASPSAMLSKLKTPSFTSIGTWNARATVPEQNNIANRRLSKLIWINARI